MGYILQVHAADVDAIVEQVTTPTLAVGDLTDAARRMLDDHQADNFDLLATTVAQAVADGGGTPEGSLVDYLLAVIVQHGHLYATLQHSSSGGEAFRAQFMTGAVADLYGPDLPARLLDRPLAGLSGDGYPTWGHLTTTETADLATHDPTIDPDDPHARDLHDLAAAIARAARYDLGIATIYA